jgi:hypothetical protein
MEPPLGVCTGLSTDVSDRNDNLGTLIRIPFFNNFFDGDVGLFPTGEYDNASLSVQSKSLILSFASKISSSVANRSGECDVGVHGSNRLVNGPRPERLDNGGESRARNFIGEIRPFTPNCGFGLGELVFEGMLSFSLMSGDMTRFAPTGGVGFVTIFLLTIGALCGSS